MNGFSFFESYYEASKVLSEDEQKKFFAQIIHYAYTGEEREELGDIAAALWTAVKPNVENSRNNSGRGGRKPSNNKNEKPTVSENKKTDGSEKKQNRRSGKGEERKGEDKGDGENNTPPLSPQGETTKTASEMIDDRMMPSQLEKSAKDWVQYKTEKRQAYKPTGLKSLLTEIQNNANRYGVPAVVSVINQSMANGYQGIMWDWLNKPNARSGTTKMDGLVDFVTNG